MNRELIVNVNPTEITIALCEDKVLVELNKEQCQTGFAVGDIYLGKVRKTQLISPANTMVSSGLIWERSSRRCRSWSTRNSPESGACASRP